MYKFRINGIHVNSTNNCPPITPKPINVIIGPNNSGKSRFLKELRDFLSGNTESLRILDQVDYDAPSTFEALDTSYNISQRMFRDIHGNWSLRVYSTRPTESFDMNTSMESFHARNFHSFSGDWKQQYKEMISYGDRNAFFDNFGALFFQYVGTEERLIISKTQRNYGMDSNSVNYLSAYKYERSLLNELRENVRKLFGKDIVLDTQTLGERIAFRVGPTFDYLAAGFEMDSELAEKLFSESKLDDQGDGVKSYVSTFLSLNKKDIDVLLLDEPEAFLHPPLARQLGELIGDAQSSNKQVFVATHSVEVLKGILTKSQNVNIIRITQPVHGKNEICLLDENILKSILQSPLLRVSRIMEGLFCEKVVITESEADELVYQELIEKIFPLSGLYFAHGQNKQTLAEIAALYQKIGISYEIIVDFDVLRISEELHRFLKLMPLKKQRIQQISQFASSLRDIVNNSVDADNLSAEELSDAQKAKRNTVYHSIGIAFFEESVQVEIRTILSELTQNHLHVLESGELETLLVPHGLPYSGNKKHWIVAAIDRIESLDASDLGKDSFIYKFLRSIVSHD